MSEQDDDQGGQVSEVQQMPAGDADTPLSDDQGVAGNPDAPDDEEVGEAGPNSNPHAGRRDDNGPR